MSQRGGTIILSTVRLLLNRSVAVPQFELRNGLRLAPVTATSFATLHRNFASSTNSSDDERSKLEKHKKETPSNEFTEGGAQGEHFDEIQKLDDLKVMWEFCDECEAKLKRFSDMEFKYRPDDCLAIRAERFTRNQQENCKTKGYDKYLKPHREIDKLEDTNLEANIVLNEQHSKAEETRLPIQIEEKQSSNFTNLGANKFKFLNKIVWNVIKWKKQNDSVIQMQQKNDAPIKKFHTQVSNRKAKKSKQRKKP